MRLHTARTEGASFISAYVGETSGEVPGQYGRALTLSLLARNESGSDLRLEPSDFRLLAPRSGKAYPMVDPESALAVSDRDRRTESRYPGTLPSSFPMAPCRPIPWCWPPSLTAIPALIGQLEK